MIRRIFSYIGPYKKYGILAAVCIVAETFFELIVPFIMADMVDVGVANGDKAYIFQRGALMAFCALAALVIGIASARFSALCGQGLGAELRKAEYQKLQEFSFGNMDHFRVSSLITRLTGDVTTIQNSVSTGMRPACRAPFMCWPWDCLSLSTVPWQLFSLWPCRYWRCCFFRSSAMCALYMRKCRVPWIW